MSVSTPRIARRARSGIAPSGRRAPAFISRTDVLGDASALCGGHRQPALRAPPQDVFGGERPLLAAQIGDFALGQSSAEILAELAFGSRITQDLRGPRAVTARKPVQSVAWQ